MFNLALADFSAFSSQGTINLCKGDTYVDEITIKNDKNIPKIFNIEQTNEDLYSYTTVFPNRLALDSFEKGTVYQVFSPRIKSLDYYQSKVIIESDGKKKLLKQDINFVECKNIEIVAAEHSYSNCPCVSTIYTFEIENIGGFSDTFYISIDMDERYYALSEEIASLQPGDKKTFYANVRLPCDSTGKISMDLLVRSGASGFEAKKPLYLSLRDDCYDFDVSFGNITRDIDDQFILRDNLTYDMLVNDSFFIPFKINNKGEFSTNYSIDAEVPHFVEVLRPDRVVDINETSNGYLYINSTNVTVKKFEALIKITSDVGQYSKSYSLEGEFIDLIEDEPPSLVYLYVGLIILLLIALFLFIFIMVKRRRRKYDYLEISANGEPLKGIEEKPKKVISRSSKWYILLIISIVILFLISLGSAFWLFWSSFDIGALDGINVTQHNFSLNQTEDVDATKEKIIEHLNDTLSYNMTDEEIEEYSNLSHLNNISEESSLLRVTNSTYAFLMDNILYMILAFILFCIMLIAVIFRHKLGFFLFIDKNKILGILLILAGLIIIIFLLTNYGLSGEPEEGKEVLADNELNLFQLVYLIILLLFIALIFIIVKFISKENIYKYFIISLAFVLVLMLITFLYFIPSGIPQEFDLKKKNMTDFEEGYVGEEENLTDYVWTKNNQKIIDFGPYIKTYDNLNFTLKTTDVENITVNVEGTKVILDPDEGWYGTRFINLIAEDEFGGVAHSPDIKLVVMDKDSWYERLPEVAFTFLLNFYMYLIYFGFLVLVVFLILVGYVRHEGDQGKNK